MAYSGNIINYLGHGLRDARPESLNIHPSALGLYMATDTNDLFLWHSNTWAEFSVGGITSWGQIEGALADQEDLVAALGAKVSAVEGKGLSTNDFTAALKNKLDGVAAQATANSADSHLLDRSNHTGTQSIGTVDGLQTELDGKASDAAMQEKADTSAVAMALQQKADASAVTLALGSKVDKETGKALSANDFTAALLSKLTGIASGATANSTDADLLARANHTGTQAIATVSGLQTALDTKVVKEAGKGLSTNDYTTVEKTKLSGIAAGAQVNSVTSVAGKTGVVTLATGDVGLGNVDNTADADKPVSTAQAIALATKAGLSAPSFIDKVRSTGSEGVFTASGEPSSGPQTGFTMTLPAAQLDRKTVEWLISSQGDERIAFRTINDAYGAAHEFLTAFRSPSGHRIDRLAVDGANFIVGQQFAMDNSYRMQVAGGIVATGPTRFGQFTLSTLPSAAAFTSAVVMVSDATGGPKLCYSDGTDWLLVNTSTVVP